MSDIEKLTAAAIKRLKPKAGTINPKGLPCKLDRCVDPCASRRDGCRGWDLSGCTDGVMAGLVEEYHWNQRSFQSLVTPAKQILDQCPCSGMLRSNITRIEQSAGTIFSARK